MGGPIWDWFCFFLSGRTQKVVLRDYCATPWLLICGVSQGSTWPPLLSNIDMKLLGDVVGGLCCGAIQLDPSMPSNPKEPINTLNWCLDGLKGLEEGQYTET